MDGRGLGEGVSKVMAVTSFKSSTAHRCALAGCDVQNIGHEFVNIKLAWRTSGIVGIFRR